MSNAKPTRKRKSSATSTAACQQQQPDRDEDAEMDTEKQTQLPPQTSDAAAAAAAIRVQLPRHLFLSTYTDTDRVWLRSGAAAFFDRHRDTPAHLDSTATSSIWSAQQRRELQQLFTDGWQQDTHSPLHALVGTCRSSAVHRAQAHDTYDERDASVGSYLRKVARGRQLVVSDVNLSLLSTAQALVRGPTLLQYHNLLAAVPTVTDTQDHTLCFAIFGTRGSYTAPHLDYYGADAFLYQVSGEKLWLCAPPDQKTAFDALLKQRDKAAGVRFTSTEKAYMERHHIRAVHQRPGEAVYMPSGWPHAVKNLTDVVSFGNSYLRPWSFGALCAYLHRAGDLDAASRLVNVAGVARAWMDPQRQREWGITDDARRAVSVKWGRLLRRLLPSTTIMTET